MKCEICGEYSGKRKVCLNCKEKYPYKPSGEGGHPFIRIDEFVKDRRR